ncbi:MAG: reverse transcriptase/maturase family protein [Candidatus Poribacteria bacterium]|nr:reverse transcriptase/maturase family protein [Candidatus Poribacteria bacterium]
MTISSGTTFASILEWENLVNAFRKAAKGKRGRPPAARFEVGVADRLIDLQRELRDGTYAPGAYRHFFIHEPKRRLISAAPFRDRVVHHALCNRIEPVFDARFIPDSYANRRRKGTHAALDRLQQFARRWRYVLRMDVVKHFPSLDHAILTDEIARVVQDERTLWLVRIILDSGKDTFADEVEPVVFPGDDLFAALRPRGLPIGNLTSQFWSNVYLNPFDWFVKRELRCPAYLRYVDDFALFGDDKSQLWEWKSAVIERLQRLRLTIHESQAQVAPVKDGIPWLGFVVYPDHRRLKRRNVVKFTRRLRRNLDLYDKDAISFAELDASVKGWVNHVRYADTWGLRQHVFSRHPLPDPPKPKPRRKTRSQRLYT